MLVMLQVGAKQKSSRELCSRCDKTRKWLRAEEDKEERGRECSKCRKEKMKKKNDGEGLRGKRERKSEAEAANDESSISFFHASGKKKSTRIWCKVGAL